MASESIQGIGAATFEKPVGTNRVIDLSGIRFTLHLSGHCLGYASGKTMLLRHDDLPSTTSVELLQKLSESALANRTVAALDDGTRIGRRATQVIECAPKRSLRIRAYTRGGLVRFIHSDLFLCTPTTTPLSLRPFREAIALCHLKQAGINVPIPLFVFVSRTAFLCGFRAVIGTEDIPEARSLLEYLRSHSNSPTIESLAQTAGAQAREALAQGVFHNDLHPGNVLVARDEEIFLIDFDGAKFLNTRADESAASEKLITRWSRFITKYGLPTAADRGFRDGVRCKANEKL